MIAAVMIRGSVSTRGEVRDTLKMLRLTRVNHCSLLQENESVKGMLRKAQSHVTWGRIDPRTLEMLVSRRGRLPGDRRIPGEKAKEIARKLEAGRGFEELGIKPIFRLSPPSGGLRSVRLAYPGGDLGNREEAINELIRRMV